MISGSSPYSVLLHLSINFVIYIFFIVGAFKGKLRFSSGLHKLMLMVYVVVSTALIMLFLLDTSPFKTFMYPVLLIWIAFTVVMARFILRSHFQQVLFLILVVVGIVFNVIQVARAIYIMDFFPRIFKEIGMHFLFINCIVLLVFLAPMWYLFFGLVRKVINMDIDKTLWKYLFVLPASAYALCIFTGRAANQSLESHLTTLLITVFLSILCYMSYVATLRMLIQTQENLLATKQATIAERKVLIQQEQYKRLADTVGQTERIRHDMRHHFLALKGYIDKKDFDGASIYIDRCIGTELPMQETPVCENHSVDMIVRHYAALAHELGVQTTIGMQVPSKMSLSDTDLCVVFGNLVENAVEGCRQQSEGRKTLSIKARLINKNMLAITIANTFNGNLAPKDNSFLSTKHDGVGVGTTSVKNVVERNGGNYKYTCTDNIFKVSILLAI